MNPLDIFLDTFKGGVTLKKVIAFSLLLLVIFVAALAFEHLTGTWELRRLEKTTIILTELNKLGDPEVLPIHLRPIYNELTEALVTQVQEVQRPAVEKEAWQTHWLSKFAAGGSIWFLVAIAFVAFFPKKEQGIFYAFVGLVMIGAFFGGINALIPTLYHPLVNLTLVPLLMFGATAGVPMSISALAAFRKVRETSIKKAILNNLRQLASAADQYFLEHGVTKVEASKLIGQNAYIKELKSVSDELYPEWIEQGRDIIADLPGEESISIDF
ncbi:hypothetical protein SH580_10295 [Coraliomargarita algicola]|uniref:MotA/TolQ/ExbB proton channel domain-containing protein n=1 Tax=Coraliomargarita algicola TaxID=3092156 RepID=A0ABZ0RYM0_9BACT|nr:hypothetical protein [Coraliomargarita sp. J2-16]WPJ98089.1 hypothetical protein SH580_10295 [Coraliomargarita sp. J2-16]